MPSDIMAELANIRSRSLIHAYSMCSLSIAQSDSRPFAFFSISLSISSSATIFLLVVVDIFRPRLPTLNLFGRSCSFPVQHQDMSARALFRRLLSTEMMEWAEAGMASAQTLVFTVDAMYGFIIGLVLYFFPHFIGNFVFLRETDGVHWHLLRCLGAQVLSIAYLNFRLRESSEAAKSASCFVRVTSSVVIMMLIAQCFTMTPNLISDWKLAIGFAFSMAMVALYGAFLMWNGWPVGGHLMPENGVSNLLHQLDSISYVCIGLTWITFPSWLLHGQVVEGLDASHEVCARLLGTFFISTFCNGLHALHWPSINDRKAVVVSRLICNAGILMAQIWSQLAYEQNWHVNHWVGITLFTGWTVLAVLHYLIHPSEGSSQEGIDQKKQD